MARDFTATAGQELVLDTTAITDEPFTLSCWWNPDTDGDYEFFGLNDKDSGGRITFMGHRNDGGTYKLRFRDYTEYVIGDAMSLDTWHHCAVSVNGTGANNVSLYTDNSKTLGSVGALHGAGMLDRIAIGRTADSTPSNESDGFVAEAAAWNVALTDAEIDVLYRGFSPLFVRPQSLVFYAPCIRGTATGDELELIAGTNLTEGGTVGIVAHPRMIYPAAPFGPFKATAAAPAGSEGPLIGGRIIRGGHLVNKGVLVA